MELLVEFVMERIKNKKVKIVSVIIVFILCAIYYYFDFMDIRGM